MPVPYTWTWSHLQPTGNLTVTEAGGGELRGGPDLKEKEGDLYEGWDPGLGRGWAWRGRGALARPVGHPGFSPQYLKKWGGRK